MLASEPTVSKPRCKFLFSPSAANELTMYSNQRLHDLLAWPSGPTVYSLFSLLLTTTSRLTTPPRPILLILPADAQLGPPAVRYTETQDDEPSLRGIVLPISTTSLATIVPNVSRILRTIATSIPGESRLVSIPPDEFLTRIPCPITKVIPRISRIASTFLDEFLSTHATVDVSTIPSICDGVVIFIVQFVVILLLAYNTTNLCLQRRTSETPYCLSYIQEGTPGPRIRGSYPALHAQISSDWAELEEDDEYVFYPVELHDVQGSEYQSFTMYKRVDKKIRPVSTTFSPDYEVKRNIPEDPLLTLPPLPFHPPVFAPTDRLSHERLKLLEINKDGFLSDEEERLFVHVMELNQRVIAFEDVERGTFRDDYFSPYKIATVPHTPWEYKNIPIPPGILQKVIDVLKLKMEAGVYEMCQSSYRSRWFCVLKKNGKLRIVHDLQPLNKVSIRDAGMLPIVDDFVEGFAGRQCYTVFDLYWGFDARRMEPESRDMTAFMTPLGLLRITSMPTGYTNSPAEFQKCMVYILHDEIPHIANVFIDDLPVKGPKSQYPDSLGRASLLPENPGIRKFIWEHAGDVHRIMHRMGCAGATISALKLQLARRQALIVGQTCTPEGRTPDTKKVSAILDWPVLVTPQEVRRFLGLCGTVRIWILNYSLVIRPLTELYRKNQDFIWDERRKDAFARIKILVASAPALRPIDYESFEAVYLSVDSCSIATGMILSQMDEQGRRRPARYGSLPMSERESRYSQPKLELFGLYRALRHWRLYIIGVKELKVEVDAKFIQGLLNNPDLQPDAAVNRWIQGILMFHFALLHVPATQFQGPDALSRRVIGTGETVESDDDDWLDEIALHLTIDPRPVNAVLAHYCNLARVAQERLLRDIYHFLRTLEAPKFSSSQKHKRFITQATRYMIHDGKFLRRNKSGPPLNVVIEPKTRLNILSQAHDDLGHRGVQPVWDILKMRFFWPRMHNDIQHHVASCHRCQIRSTKKLEIPLTVATPTALFQTVYIDIMMMPEADGFRMIVAARDDLSGACEAQALKTKTAEDLAGFFVTYLYSRYGCPRKVVTDNGPEVKAGFKRLMKDMNVPHVRISPYNKHANGVVEQGHFTLREALVKSCGGKMNLWPKKLPMALLADRITVSRVTGFSPYQLLYAADPVLPFDLTEATFLVSGFRSGMTTTELLTLRIRQLSKHERDIKRAADTLKKARFRSKEHFERKFVKKLQKDEYKRGELVIIRNVGIEMEVSTKKKTADRYFGPYEVERKNQGGAYILRELDGAPFRQNPTAAFRLLPYITRSHWFMRTGWMDDDGEETDSAEDDESLFETSEDD
jgi:hypothetical protein